LAALRLQNYPIATLQKFLSGECCSKKDLVIALAGVARSEIRALSGAGMDGLVALETWRAIAKIANLTKSGDSHGGYTAIGRVNR
jgi:hypothetical protein